MANFLHGTVEPRALAVRLEDDGRTAWLNARGTVRFSHLAAQVTIETTDGQKREHLNRRAVIQAPNGAKVLPYFERDGVAYAVFVEQFRIALLGPTLEPPGGEADEDDVKVSMARELEEEARIRVNPADIDVVYGAFIQPSMMRSRAYGGIVRIEESALPQELLAGEHQFGEYTVLAVRPFLPLLKERDAGALEVDLETWLLLDAVAQALGLIVRKY